MNDYCVVMKKTAEALAKPALALVVGLGSIFAVELLVGPGWAMWFMACIIVPTGFAAIVALPATDIPKAERRTKKVWVNFGEEKDWYEIMKGAVLAWLGYFVFMDLIFWAVYNASTKGGWP